MPSSVSVELKGLRETQRNLEQLVKDLTGPPMLDGMRDSTLMVQRDAKRNLVARQSKEVGGSDTGILRASITPEVTVQGRQVVGIVGSNKQYAPYVELDTRPHWVPKGVLAVWARRHHVTESIVRWGIARHGTKGKHYLERAFTENETKIKARLERAVAKMAEEANR